MDKPGGCKKSQVKVVTNGHVIEIYEYEKPVPNDFEGRGGRKRDDERASERSEENRRLTKRRARDTIRRLCLANFDEHSKFVTLTFAKNIIDVRESNREFKKFIQRLRRRYKDFKYVAVIEFQERGAVHYHMMSDLPYIPNKELSEIWGQGFVKITDITHVDNVGAYMIKYMLKDVSDPRLLKQKAYLTSKGLERSLTFRGEEAQRIIEEYDLKTKKEVFENSYQSEHFGQVYYKEYNLKRDTR